MLTYWTIWLFVLLPVSFGVAEAYALHTSRPTLSEYVWRLSKAWPLFPFVAGVLTGGLAVHFWWGGVACFVGCAASPVSP
jgi:hypothetical protein